MSINTEEFFYSEKWIDELQYFSIKVLRYTIKTRIWIICGYDKIWLDFYDSDILHEQQAKTFKVYFDTTKYSKSAYDYLIDRIAELINKQRSTIKLLLVYDLNYDK